MFIFCNRPSKSAYKLSKGIPAIRCRKKVPIDKDSIFINWGSTININKNNWINPPEAVARVSNKLTFFRIMKETKLTPKFYETSGDCEEEAAPKQMIACRTILNGHRGKGLILREKENLIDAPLYVEYKKKKYEFRIHVFMGEIIDVSQKARKLDVPDNKVNWQIRNNKNGWIYKREINFNHIHYVKEAALLAMFKIKLDFGAVDVIWSTEDNCPYVLEINSAPGLEGTTLQRYIDAFRRLNN